VPLVVAEKYSETTHLSRLLTLYRKVYLILSSLYIGKLMKLGMTLGAKPITVPTQAPATKGFKTST